MNDPQQTESPPETKPKSAIAQKWLVAILVLTSAFVLMPFLLWYMTTFSRPLTDADLAQYFTDAEHPRFAQHALSQIADRILSSNPTIRESAKPWYPEVIKFSEQGSDELRVTAAWVMGQDNQSPEFHAALLKQLADSNPMVQRNAALSLVRFKDPSGHDIIVSMLEPYTVVAPRAGVLAARLKPGDVINPGTLVAGILVAAEKTEVRSQVPGTIERWIAADGASVQAQQPMLVVDPSLEMVWESLRALYLIGGRNDLTIVDRYAHGGQGASPQVQQQAELTSRAISSHIKQ